MFRFLFVAFLVVPIAELYVFAQVGNNFGFGATLLGIVFVSVVGAWLVKMEGWGVWIRAQQRLARGEAPTDELLNGLLILFAGALMLTPGFLTDVFGLTLLFPPTRALYRGVLRKRLVENPNVVTIGGFGASRFRTAQDVDGADVDGVWDVEGWEEPPDRPPLP